MPAPPGSSRDGTPLRETAVRPGSPSRCRPSAGLAGQIAVMQRILVVEKRWIGQLRFLLALPYCTLLPGLGGATRWRRTSGWLLDGHQGRARGPAVAGPHLVAAPPRCSGRCPGSPGVALARHHARRVRGAFSLPRARPGTAAAPRPPLPRPGPRHRCSRPWSPDRQEAAAGPASHETCTVVGWLSRIGTGRGHFAAHRRHRPSCSSPRVPRQPDARGPRRAPHPGWRRSWSQVAGRRGSRATTVHGSLVVALAGLGRPPRPTSGCNVETAVPLPHRRHLHTERPVRPGAGAGRRCGTPTSTSTSRPTSCSPFAPAIATVDRHAPAPPAEPLVVLPPFRGPQAHLAGAGCRRHRPGLPSRRGLRGRPLGWSGAVPRAARARRSPAAAVVVSRPVTVAWPSAPTEPRQTSIPRSLRRRLRRHLLVHVGDVRDPCGRSSGSLREPPGGRASHVGNVIDHRRRSTCARASHAAAGEGLRDAGRGLLDAAHGRLAASHDGGNTWLGGRLDASRPTSPSWSTRPRGAGHHRARLRPRLLARVVGAPPPPRLGARARRRR